MKEVTELFEKIMDQLYYLCPGFVLLGSLTLWMGPNVNTALLAHENATIGLAFLLGYVFAWLLVVLCQLIQVRFVEAVTRLDWPFYLRRLLGNQALSNHLRELSHLINEVLDRRLELGPGVIPRLREMILGPSESLAICRALASRVGARRDAAPREAVDRDMELDKILREADRLQSDFAVHLSLAFAMVLVSSQLVARLVLHFAVRVFPLRSLSPWEVALSPVNPVVLVSVAVLSLGAFSQLRQHAMRAWVLELVLISQFLMI